MGVDAVDGNCAGHRSAGEACHISIKKAARGRCGGGAKHHSCGLCANPCHLSLRSNGRNPEAVEQRTPQDFQHILRQGLIG